MFFILYDENKVITDIYQLDSISISSDYKNADLICSGDLIHLEGIKRSVILLNEFSGSVGDVLTDEMLAGDIKNNYISIDLQEKVNQLSKQINSLQEQLKIAVNSK